jgi:hypothetical protein
MRKNNHEEVQKESRERIRDTALGKSFVEGLGFRGLQVFIAGSGRLVTDNNRAQSTSLLR